VSAGTLPDVACGAENYSVAGSSKRVPRKTAKKSAEPPIKMVVRRGATPRFEALTRKTRHLNVQVVWDRRTEEQDAAEPRQHENRRGAPPFTWDVADFVVVVPAKPGKPEE
jgi:hypothetical protein